MITISSCGSGAQVSKWCRCGQWTPATTEINWIKSYIVDTTGLNQKPFLRNLNFMTDSKILVTSWTAFPRFSFTYNLKLLNAKDAMTLFRHSASLQDGSSDIPDEDIKKVLCDIYALNMLNFIWTFYLLCKVCTWMKKYISFCLDEYIIKYAPGQKLVA